MMQVANRTIRSVPQRTCIETWEKIVNILSEHDSTVRQELEKVTGIASMIISDKVCLESPIVVECVGPTTRIFCSYDDDAIDGSNANENSFNFNPLNGSWIIYLPCHKDDLRYYSDYLKKKSGRVKLRESSENKLKKVVMDSKSNTAKVVKVDTERFMRS